MALAVCDAVGSLVYRYYTAREVYMPKTSIYLPDDLAAQARAYGISISAVSQAALRQAVAAARDKEELMDGMTEIRVQTGPEPALTEIFTGRWLVDPESERSRVSEKGYDRHSVWGVAVTKRGNIAVYAGHRSRSVPACLTVHESLEDAAKELPASITRLAAAALGHQRVLRRDI
jgi:post-segregation antitoxin (ccd killing protein)